MTLKLSRRALVASAGCLLFASAPIGMAEENVGRFQGTLVLRDYSDSDSSKFLLEEDLMYIDPAGREWYAWRGLETDGASIPRFLWAVVGSPFTGQHRRAAVIHDFYCANRFRNWEDVSNVFYDAMITDGVNSSKALLMYYAVVRFGPYWTLNELTTCPADRLCANPGKLDVAYSTASIAIEHQAQYVDEIEQMKTEIATRTLDLTELRQLAASKPELPRTFATERITDNWADKRWRHVPRHKQ